MMIQEQEQEQELERELERELALALGLALADNIYLSVSKKKLAVNISNKLELPINLSSDVVNNFFEFIKKNYKDNINIHKFGTFSFKTSPKRMGRNPKTLEEFEIKARTKLSFKASEEIKGNIN